jgi:hypothetical protein
VDELHPVKTIQKVDPDTALGGDLANGWCGLLAAVPPPGATPGTMTQGQSTTWQAQLQPANRWQLHPAVDGCQGPFRLRPPHFSDRDYILSSVQVYGF